MVVAEGEETGVEISPLISYVSRRMLAGRFRLTTLEGGEGLDFLKGRTINASIVIEMGD